MSDPFDFDQALPPEKRYFTLRYLSRLWECSVASVQRLIDEGSLKVAVDLAPKKSVKSMQRITRESVVELLNSRKSGTFRRDTKRGTSSQKRS